MVKSPDTNQQSLLLSMHHRAGALYAVPCHPGSKTGMQVTPWFWFPLTEGQVVLTTAPPCLPAQVSFGRKPRPTHSQGTAKSSPATVVSYGQSMIRTQELLLPQV